MRIVIKKENILLLVLFFAALYSVSAHSNKTVCGSCNFLVTIAPPQLLTNKALTQSQVDLVYFLAVRDGHVLDDGTVSSREGLAKLALLLLARKDFELAFGSAPPDGAELVGYILEIETDGFLHYALTGTNRNIIYNPCNVHAPAQTFLEVYAFAN